MTSKLVLGLAVGASAAVGAVAITGHALSTPEVIGALFVAGGIAVLNVLDNRPVARPHVLVPVADTTDGVVIAAPQARTLVTEVISHSDAA